MPNSAEFVSNEGTAAAAWVRDALLARKTKNAATPPSTHVIITSKLRIPQFIPAAIAESDWP
jgi:hypothetical protein